MKKPFKIKKPKSNFYDGYIKMPMLMTKITTVFCFVGVIGLWVYLADIPMHWRLIASVAVFVVSIQISILSIVITTIIVGLLKLKQCCLHRMIVGVIYGMVSSGSFLFFMYNEWNKERLIGGVVAIFLICTIIGFVSARVLPDE